MNLLSANLPPTPFLRYNNYTSKREDTMLSPLEKYPDQSLTELLPQWLWGITIKNYKDKIVKRVLWQDGSITLTFWERPELRTYQYEHTNTMDFPTTAEYVAWLPTLENWNGVE
jgi:hypothetical protein